MASQKSQANKTDSAQALQSKYAWLKIELSLSTNPEEKFVELLNSAHLSFYDKEAIVEFLGIEFFTTERFIKALWPKILVDLTNVNRGEFTEFLSPQAFFNENFLKTLTQDVIEKILILPIFQDLNDLFLQAKKNLILAQGGVPKGQYLLNVHENTEFLKLSPEKALLEAAWLVYEGRFERSGGVFDKVARSKGAKLGVADKEKFFQNKKLLNQYILLKGSYESVIKAKPEMAMLFDNHSAKEQETFKSSYYDLYLNQSNMSLINRARAPSINSFLFLQNQVLTLSDILLDLTHLKHYSSINVKALQYLQNANSEQLMEIIDNYIEQCQSVSNTSGRTASVEVMVDSLLTNLMQIGSFDRLVCDFDKFWPLIQKRPMLTALSIIVQLIPQEKFIDALALNPSLIFEIRAKRVSKDWVEHLADKNVILKCLKIEPHSIVYASNEAWFEDDTLTSLFANNLSVSIEPEIVKKIKRHNKKFYSLQNFEIILEKIMLRNDGRLETGLEYLISNTPFKAQFDSRDSKAIYDKYLSLLDKHEKRVDFIPDWAMQDVDYIIEKIKAHPNLELKNKCTPFLVYSKKYCQLLLQNAYEKTNSQDIEDLKKHLPKIMVDFFKKAGFEANMFSAAISMLEKSNLKDAVSQRRGDFTLEFEFDDLGNIINQSIPAKEEKKEARPKVEQIPDSKIRAKNKL